MSQSLLPLFLKVGVCTAVSCTTGIPSDLAKGVLGNITHDLLKKIPGGLRLHPLGEPNHDLQKALARAISQASEDVNLEKMIRDATGSLTDLQPPFHYQVEQFLADLHRRPEEILRTTASNTTLKTFLEAPSPESFQPLASALGEEHLPGLPPDLRYSIVQAIHLQIAARFWDEIKSDDKSWRAYSYEVFTEFRDSIATLASGQHEILAALGQREIHIAAAAILPEAAAAIDITHAHLEKDFQALRRKLDGILQGQREIKRDTTRIRRALPWLVGLVILGVGIGGLTHRNTGQTATDAAISKKEDLKQTEILEKLLAARSEQTREFQQQGRRIQDIPQEEIETDLARRLALPVETLRASIAASLKSKDSLTRGQAELLAGYRDQAIATATEAKLQHADAIQQLITADAIIAQAHYEKAEYHPALAARQRIAAFLDPQVEPLAWADAQHDVAFLLLKLARLVEASTLLQQVVLIRERELGPADLSLAAALNILACVLRDQGKITEAEQLLRKVLEIEEMKMGKDHPVVATDLNNLAELYRVQGKLADAEILYHQALEISEAALGNDHLIVATILNNLALLLQAQGKQAEAEPLFRRALKIYEMKLGKDHADIAPLINNLAGLLGAQAKLTEPELLYRRAIDIGEAKLGIDHPDVAIWLNNLAILLETQGNLVEAEPLSRRQLLIFFLHRKRNYTPHQHEQAAIVSYTRLLEKMKRTPEQIVAELETIKRDAGLEE